MALLALLSAGVAKLADAPDLGSGLERGIGSNPFPGKSLKIRKLRHINNTF
jgi:hypothetical protein